MCIGCKQCEQACATENGLPYDDKIAAEEVTLRPQVHHRPYQGRQVHAPAVHALRRSRLRLGLPGGRLEKTAAGPVIYDEEQAAWGAATAWSPARSACPSTSGSKAIPEVRKCIMCARPRSRRQADRMRRNLSHRRNPVWRSRRTARGSQEAHPRQSRATTCTTFSARRGRRNVRPAALLRSFQPLWLSG